jgi:hypothetical protein
MRFALKLKEDWLLLGLAVLLACVIAAARSMIPALS